MVGGWSTQSKETAGRVGLVQPGQDKVSGKVKAAYKEVTKKAEPGSLQRSVGRE